MQCDVDLIAWLAECYLGLDAQSHIAYAVLLPYQRFADFGGCRLIPHSMAVV